jgi:hypothetical protein
MWTLVPAMSFLDVSALLLLACAAWLWLDSLKARETAIRATKAACNSENLMLLDDTIAIRGIRLSRNDDGALQLHRVYGFEYSDTGNNRRTGTLAMLGNSVLVINLDLVTSQPAILH